MFASLLTIIYLIASVTFIVGLKMLSHPETARRGNLIAAGGMGIAIFGTIFLYKTSTGEHLGNLVWMFAALIIGAVLGTISSKKVKMTAMPEMVSLFNGMGGACAMLISLIEFNHAKNTTIELGHFLAIVLGLIIGSISFAGSIIAYLKLSGKQKDISFKGQHIFNALLFLIILVGAVITYNADVTMAPTYFYITFALAVIYGVFFVLPIGGADMPVVISLLNSLTGVAAACGGFLYNNKAMLTGGILVGAAGTLLTVLMCKAMNRSLLNVIIGNWGGSVAASSNTSAGGDFKEVTLSDAAMVMSYANKVVIVPGYGLAVAQAQHTCHELEKILTDKGVEVTYAIHPVAGRMPGHMNVLLAEADVAYEKLEEMEEANNNFKNTDVVLILGANDVVNPAAKNDPSSPIYGMPILEVEQAKTVIVNKRSMKPGYAGIENALFFQPKTSMLFGDAKKVLQDLCAEIKAS
ncbi:NAD(P)(+) transhydrogenase (Re/Si-specific) subunit beta [Ferruginibacter yonginensis]|uniref:NAD(P) transhydrogenase subunit beta n=1 Tax=Ferruginibacter yonginensis TaxID=1310416 RepID=A0ABV8QVL1_9BACT